ncbi:hypothetical protein HK105_206160 [Polyrhizophydium stewartii]|uniref:Cyclic nucleotide-binding domain-containing protein n=1 Tax=Polyrhizophydium stewartii TaxID=2732419 RepID=A0ABR4N4G7_9FUNG
MSQDSSESPGQQRDDADSVSHHGRRPIRYSVAPSLPTTTDSRMSLASLSSRNGPESTAATPPMPSKRHPHTGDLEQSRSPGSCASVDNPLEYRAREISVRPDNPVLDDSNTSLQSGNSESSTSVDRMTTRARLTSVLSTSSSSLDVDTRKKERSLVKNALKGDMSKALAAEVANALTSKARYKSTSTGGIVNVVDGSKSGGQAGKKDPKLEAVKCATETHRPPKWNLRARGHPWRAMFNVFVLARRCQMVISCMDWQEMTLPICENEVRASDVFKAMMSKYAGGDESAVSEKGVDRVLLLCSSYELSSYASLQIAEMIRGERTQDVVEQLEKLISMQNRKFRSFAYDQRLKFCRVMRFEEHEERRIIIKEGHLSHAFYFVLSGQVIVFKIKDGKWIQLNVLGKGESFGDRSMNVLNDKRTAYIATNTRCKFLVIDKADYHAIANNRDEARTATIRAKLLSLTHFANAPNGFIEKIAPSCEIIDYEPNNTIITEGALPYQMFLIIKGACRRMRVVPFAKHNNEESGHGIHDDQLHAWDPDTPLPPGLKRVNLLTVCNLGPGDSFPVLPWPHKSPPMLPLDKSEYARALDAHDDTSNSIVTTAPSEILVLQRSDLVWLAPGEVVCDIVTEGMGDPTIRDLQVAYIQRQQWDQFKRKTVKGVTGRRTRHQ